jgi:hypothetical protein
MQLTRHYPVLSIPLPISALRFRLSKATISVVRGHRDWPFRTGKPRDFLAGSPALR